ncbi:VWA domain-containing protein [Ectothiorhodospiraceae bacterium 2226]|nr:VWA domain-containing protein [Ectothiorhodospiraceae bacterium 2226]
MGGRVCGWALRLAAGILSAAALTGCGEPVNNSRAAFVLIDISSDYAGELQKAQTLTNYLLANLESGDSLGIGFIDNSSFTERNIIARATFDHRPSVTTRQKREVRAQLDAFVQRFRVPSHHSDITGGVLLASDYLNETKAGQRYLFILSDLHEDLPPWLNRSVGVNLEAIEVIAVNVKRQRRDNNDPQAYRQRLAGWQQRVEESGGQWRVVNDLARLESAVVLR